MALAAPDLGFSLPGAWFTPAGLLNVVLVRLCYFFPIKGDRAAVPQPATVPHPEPRRS